MEAGKGVPSDEVVVRACATPSPPSPTAPAASPRRPEQIGAHGAGAGVLPEYGRRRQRLSTSWTEHGGATAALAVAVT